MAETTPEKTHTLLKELTEYEKNNVQTKKEVDAKIEKLDDKVGKLEDKTGIMEERLDRLTEYVLNEIPTKREMKEELEEKADIKDIQKILDGQDAMVNQLDIIRTEQYAFNSAFKRIEKRVEVLESEI